MVSGLVFGRVMPHVPVHLQHDRMHQRKVHPVLAVGTDNHLGALDRYPVSGEERQRPAFENARVRRSDETSRRQTLPEDADAVAALLRPADQLALAGR